MVCIVLGASRKARQQRLAGGGGKEEGKHVPDVSRETTRPVGRTHVQAQRGASAAAAASARAGFYLALELLDTFGREVWVHAPLDTDAGTCDEKAYRRASNRAGQQLRNGRGEKGGTRA